MGAVKHIEYIQGIENQALGSAKDAFPIQFHLFSVFSYLFFLNRKLLSLSHAMSILEIGLFLWLFPLSTNFQFSVPRFLFAFL